MTIPRLDLMKQASDLRVGANEMRHAAEAIRDASRYLLIGTVLQGLWVIILAVLVFRLS